MSDVKGTPRQLVSSEVLDNLAELCEKANGVAQRAEERLDPICHSRVEDGNKDPKAERKEYPSFFNEVRDKMESLGVSLRRINDMLDRCEI